MDYTTKDLQQHIVEFGCATGLLLSLLKKKGFNNITGVDPSPSCAETAKKHYGINVLTNTMNDVAIEDGSVDFLILIGVLEHIKDLDASLITLRNMLSPSGKICIIVPDASQYYKGKDAPFQEFSIEHINFFGPTSLNNLLNKNGFSKVDISQMPIEVNFNTITPIILSVFEKKPETGSTLSYDIDLETRNNLVTYIDDCKNKEEAVNRKINKIIEHGKPIIVWGTGAQTLRLLANSKLHEAKINAFVDSNPKYQGKTVQDIPVIAPQALKDRTETILISTRAYQNEIENQIRNQLKLNNEIVKLY